MLAPFSLYANYFVSEREQGSDQIVQIVTKWAINSSKALTARGFSGVTE